MPPLRLPLLPLLLLGLGLGALLALPAPAEPKGTHRALIEQAKAELREARFEAAEATARQALAFASRQWGERDRRTAGPLTQLGIALAFQGRLSESEEALQRAVEIRTATLGPHPKTAATLRHLGKTLTAQGRYGEAMKRLQEARAMLERLGREESPDLARLLDNLAALHLALGQAEGAERWAGEAFRVAREYYLGRPHELAAKSLILWSQAALARGDAETAAQRARQAVETAEAARDGDHPLVSKALVPLGKALRELGRLEESEAVLRRALAIRRTRLGPDHPALAKAARHLARTLERRGRPEEAEALYRQALEIARHHRIPAQLLDHSHRLGALLAAQGRPEEAWPLYLEAMEMLERLHAGSRDLDEELRGSLLQRYDRLYREAMELLLELHRRQPQEGYDRAALEVASRTQSRLFSELLRLADVRRYSDEPRFLVLRRELEGARERLAALHLRAAGELEEDGVVDAVAQGGVPGKPLATAEAALAQAEAALWREYPRYMELTQPRPVSAARLQGELLGADEALLGFYLLPQTTLVFAVTPTAFRLHLGPLGADEVAATVAQVHDGARRVAREGRIAPLAGLDPERLTALYRGLIEPLEGELARAKRIWVVGDGALHTLPLELLARSWDEDAFRAARRKADGSRAHPLLGEYAHLDYLGDHYRFRYLPSLTALESLRLYPKRGAEPELELVAFADPRYPDGGSAANGEGVRTAARAQGRERLELPPLPETADEARAAAASLGGNRRLFLGDAAQEVAAKGPEPGRARYLLFATHGLLGGEYLALGGNGHAQPALALSLVGDLEGEDGLLTMGEVIESLDLHARLVALSACNSAGEGTRAASGEGFAGLTRAFLYAGARGLWVSHWSVETESTRELMEEAFAGLKAGLEPGAALAAARRRLRGGSLHAGSAYLDRSHPFFWAAFVQVGE